MMKYLLPPPSQVIDRFWPFRFVDFVIMHLDILYVCVCNDIYASIKIETTYNLKRREYILS
jgi:hypothetical protein